MSFARRIGRHAGHRPAALLVALAFVATSAFSLATPSATLAWSAGSASSASEKQLVALTNQSRAAAGLKALKVDSTLTSVARWRSKDMINRDYFSHDIPGYGKVYKKLDAVGYCYKVAGENIGWNTYPDAEATAQIHQMFMGSSGHRANILGRSWDVIGVGSYKGADGKKMWTVLFADKCGTTVKATPKPTVKPKPAATPKPKPQATPQADPEADAEAHARSRRPSPTPTPVPTPRPNRRTRRRTRPTRSCRRPRARRRHRSRTQSDQGLRITRSTAQPGPHRDDRRQHRRRILRRVTTTLPAMPPILEARELAKSYPLGETIVDALRGVSLTVEEGEFVALMGPSGSGKSTLLQLLGGLDKPSSGVVVLEGQVVSDLSDDEVTRLRRDRTGFVFQSFNLIPLLDVTENVALPFTIAGQDPSKEELRSRIRDAIALVDLTGEGAPSSPTSSRWGNSSAWPSPERWSPAPPSSSPTSPPATSTTRPAPRSSMRSGAPASSATRPSCS